MDHFLTTGPFLLQSNLLGWIHAYFHNSNKRSCYVNSPPTYFTNPPPLPIPTCNIWAHNPKPLPLPAPHISLDQVPATASYLVSLSPVLHFQWSLSNVVNDAFQRKLLSISHLNNILLFIALRIKPKIFNKVCRTFHKVISTYPSSFILHPTHQPCTSYFIDTE